MRSWRKRFRRVAIAGVGLMGGALGQVLGRLPDPPLRIGWDRRSLKIGDLPGGTVSRMAGSLEEACLKADLVILAVPVEGILELLERLPDLVDRTTVVTDLGGAKQEVCQAGNKSLGGICSFIGGHPMAGSEQQGAVAVKNTFFKGRAWALCPGADVEPDALEALSDLIGQIGACPVVLDPQEHDEAVARISHLPQILAVALLRLAAESPRARILERLSAGGFDDLTRIGSCPFPSWRDLFSHNKRAILSALGDYTSLLGEIRRLLELAPDDLEESFRAAAQAREAILKAAGFDPGLS